LAPKPLKELIENNPIIDEAIYSDYPKKGDSKIFSIINLLKNFLHIPKIISSHFDACIILTHSFATVILAKLCFIPHLVGAKLRIATKDNAIDTHAKYYTDLIEIFAGKIHTSLRFQTIIRSYFNIYNNALPVLPCAKNYDRVTKEFIYPYRKFYHVGVCTQGSFLTKYPSQKFAKVIKEISKKYPVRFYILGSKAGLKTAQELMQLCNEHKGVNIYNLCQKTTLLEVLNFISACDLTITVDTGIAHMAAVSNKPMINLCGGTNPKFSRAMSAKSELLYFGEGCFDCNMDNNFCRTQPFQFCMDKIPPESVIKEAFKVLDKIKK
jgi:heptosyltransferase-2